MATVYISSTYSDLKACRERVYLALRQLKHDARAMEDYVASDTRPLQKCLEDVGRCDIYVGIFAWRYGFIPKEENPDEKSITELEFRHASKCGIPTLTFLLKEDAKWPRSSMDVGEESKNIDSLRSELKDSQTVSFFEDCENLAALVSAAVTNKVKELEQKRDEKALKAAGGWLEAHLGQTEREFISHMSGVDHLTEDQASGRYIELLVEKQTKSDQEREPARPLSEYAARRGARLALLGEGGAGKTTSLLRLAFDAARRAKLDSTAPIPLYAKLNFFDTKERGLDELMQIIADSAGLEKDQVLSQWRDDSRSILFLMDGFNEIRSEFQASCSLALEALMQRRQHTYVITSRPISQVHNLAERAQIDKLNTVQLNDDQLEDFLARYGAASLYRQMGPELKGLVRNPFLVWAFAQSCVGLAKAELPSNKGQLYRNLIDRYLFETHEQQKEPSPTEYNYELVKKPVLALLALGMTKEGVTRKGQDIQLLRKVHTKLTEIRTEYEGPMGVRPYELMPDPPSAKGILDESVLNGVLRCVGDTIEFMHQSVQDYFTAVGMLDWTKNQIMELAPPLSFRNAFERSDGFEAIVMLAGLKDDTRELLRTLNGHNPMLAAHCLAASSPVARTVRAELLDYWKTMLHQQNEDYRKLACSCLGTARIDSDEVLGELILALGDNSYEVRYAAKLSLSQIKSIYAVKYLADRGLSEPYGDETLRELSGVLFEIDLDAAVKLLFEKWRETEQGTERRRRAEILLTPRSRENSRVLKQLFAIRLEAIRRDDAETSRAAKEAIDLLKVWQETYEKKRLFPLVSEIRKLMHETGDLVESVPGMSTPELIEHLKQQTYVAGHVATEIGKRGDIESIEPLVEALYRQHIPQNIEPMVNALESIDRTQAAQSLRVGLQGSDFAFQTRAAVALGLMGDFDAIALVRKALRVENAAFRSSAARVLGNLGDDEAVAALTDAVRSESDEEVLKEMVLALGNTKAETAAHTLLKLLLRGPLALSLDSSFSNGRETLRQLVSRALVEAAGAGQVITWLQEAARDKDSFVRARAIEGMADLDEKAYDNTGLLREACDDPSPTVRAVALRGIATRTTDQELRKLFEAALKDEDANVRGTALGLWANAELEGAQAVLLESVLSDRDSHVRKVAATNLRRFLDWAIDQLSQMLEQGETERRIAAVKTLAEIVEGQYRSIPDEDKEKVLVLLSSALRDLDKQVRLAAVRAMRSYNHRESGPLVIPVLVDVAWHGESVEIRQEAAQTLAYMDGGQAALYKRILDRLDDPGEYVELVKLIGEDQPFLPNHGFLYALRGSLYQNLRRFDKAQDDCETALKLGFDGAWLRKFWANNLAELGRHADAREAARKAAEYEPENAEAHLSLGWYAYKTGDYREAIEESKIALGLDPNLAMAAFNLGLAYIADHRIEEARNAYDQAATVCEGMDEENRKATIQAALNDVDELMVAKPELGSDAKEVTSKFSSILSAGRTDNLD